MAGELITQPWQVEYDGELFGTGTPVRLVRIEGLEDLPALRGANVPLGGYDGSHRGRRLLGDKRLIVTFQLVGTPDVIAAEVRRLRRATRNRDGELPLVVSLPQIGNRTVHAAPERRTLPVDKAYQIGHPQAVVEFSVSDPTVYGAEHSTLIPVFVPAGGGFTYPVMYPKDYGGPSSGGTVTVPNDGDADTWPRFVIHGPSSGAMTVQRIENLTDGLDLDFGADGGLVISSGRSVVVDTHPARRVVAFTDGASRWNTVASTAWWPIHPGGAAMRLRATGSIDGAVCECATADAY